MVYNLENEGNFCVTRTVYFDFFWKETVTHKFCQRNPAIFFVLFCKE
jgi:hypothetical protein